MKRKILVILSLIVFTCFNIKAQELVWVKNKVSDNVKSVVTDNLGNIYEFYSFSFSYNDSSGSYIKKYDNNGNLLFSKTWTTSFLINDVKYDNTTNRLFATGNFTGNITVDGKNIVSKGSSDVFIAELDLQATILSIKTFGGRNSDSSNGITLTSSSTNIYITGGVSDSVYMNNTLLNARQTQSMFIASFTKSLIFNNIQYFDFRPEMNDPYSINMGKEIVLDNSGNLFVMYDQEGLHPMSYENMPEKWSGRYVMKIHNSGNVIFWSQRIIGDEAYYGWSARRLRVNAIHDAFLIRSHSGKYSDNSEVLRLDGVTGNIIWEYSYTPDSRLNQTYRDLIIDNTNSLILIGNEGRDDCPCETAKYGYDVVKKFNSSNALLWEKRLYDLRSSYITLDHQQNIYLTGGTFIAKMINGGAAPTIITGSISGSPFNPGASISVPYTVSSSFTSGNIFTAQLSDPFGSFTTATNIGTLTSTSSGTINAIIPVSASPGTAYRIRVIGSSPLRYGKDNGTDLAISGGTQTIIAAGSSWKYLDNGTNQGTTWRSTSFSDAAWKTGNAELGYGDGGEVTTVSYGPSSTNKYITTYFRKTVNISNPAQYTNFQLGLLRDDGAVVYVNGIEVARSNMPTGTISYTTKASSAIDGSGESAYNNFNIPSSRFINGNNVIAVEIHQSSASSSDISFNLRLSGVKAAPSNDLIPANASWQYKDDGSDWAGGGWTIHYIPDDHFNDWKTGNAELGYGDGDEATKVSYGPDANNKYITTYFRKVFHVDASEIEALKLEVLRDDGIIVYMNDYEIYRNNVAGSGNNTVASSTIDGTDEKTWISTVLHEVGRYLLNGRNVIGVEIHQASKSSSDISFNLRLTPTKPLITDAPVTCSGTGQILRDYWANIPGDQVSQIPVGTAPTETRSVYRFEQDGFDEGDNWGARYRGYICPPYTGAYTFWIASDDDSELWLSTNDNPANKTKIASVSGWTEPRDWNKYPSQKSVTINLTAGNKYYIEALHKEATGGDNLSVGWQLPTGEFQGPIPGSRLLPASSAPATNTELIAANSSWKYLDNGTNQGTTWRAVSFSDATWKTGNAELGYGDGGEATVVSYGPNASNKYITTYFRKTFNVADANAFTGLELSLLRDDGAVVYLNGVEVFRANMPTGTISYTTLAGSDGWSETTYQIANISKSALVTGNNVLAVEIHQNSPSSSDISFNLKLKGLTGGARIADLDSLTEIETAKADFVIYPNPTSGNFSFEFCLDDVKEENLSVEIVNAVGQVVYKKEPQKINGCIREIIELEKSLPAGIYMMNVITEKETKTQKVLLTN